MATVLENIFSKTFLPFCLLIMMAMLKSLFMPLPLVSAVLVTVPPTNGLPKAHVSDIWQIDNIGDGQSRANQQFKSSFYVKANFHELDSLVICYLSQLDEKYRPSNKSLQFRAGFTLRNIVTDRDNNVAELCDPREWFKDKNVPQPDAWHGLRIQLDSAYQKDFYTIQTSFSNERIHLKFNKKTHMRNQNYIKIHFGTPESPLRMQYTNIEGANISLEFPENSMPRIPPADALNGVTNIREAFQANPGAWLIPMDMAQLEEIDGSGPTRMVYFVAYVWTEDDMPKISLVMNNNGIEYEVFATKKEGKTTTHDGATTEKTAQSSKSPSTESSMTTVETTVVTTSESTTVPKPAGKTHLVNAKAAMIRYDFADINVCPDFKNPANCRVEYNYAVRIGCIDCKPGITREEQNKFLGTLREYLQNEQKKSESAGLNIYDVWNNCAGTTISSFLSYPQYSFINDFEPGEFRYYAVPKSWAENGLHLHMLIHEYEGLGLFATAFCNGTVKNNYELEAKLNWQKKFEFLDICKVQENKIVDEYYQLNSLNHWKSNKFDGPYSVIYKNKHIHFGTYKWNAQTSKKEDNTMSYEQVQALKFFKNQVMGSDFGLHSTEYLAEGYNKYALIKRWGRAIAEEDLMYENYNNLTTHNYDIYLKSYKKSDIPNGRKIPDRAFDNAKVHVIISQMVIDCSEHVHMTTRVNAIQIIFDYKVYGQAQDVEPKHKLVLQTKAYKLDNIFYELDFDPGQKCVRYQDCLSRWHIYMYANKTENLEMMDDN